MGFATIIFVILSVNSVVLTDQPAEVVHLLSNKAIFVVRGAI